MQVYFGRAAAAERRGGARLCRFTGRPLANALKIASRLRQETTMNLKWIAHRLKMGAWTHVSNCLVQSRKDNEKCQ